MRKLLLFIPLMVFVSCRSSDSDNSSSSLDEYADSVEAGITGTSGALDDASNQAVVAQEQNNFWSNLLISNAYAACSRSLTNNGSGNCSRDVNCDFAAYTWSGSVDLNFANGSTCSLSGSGDSFTRVVDFTRSGPRGSLRTTSDDRETWDSQTIGGGMTVTQVDAGGNLEMEIEGQHKILTRNLNGATVFDISISTASGHPLAMNKLARSGRVISSGVLEVRHNRAKFTAEHTFNNVTYSSSCCYPTSGTISSEFSGSLTGSGSVTFNGCGSYAVTYKGETKSYDLGNCE